MKLLLLVGVVFLLQTQQADATWTCPSNNYRGLFRGNMSCTTGTRTAACKVKLDACITAASTSCTDVAHCYSDWFQCKNLAIYHNETGCGNETLIKAHQQLQSSMIYSSSFETGGLYGGCVDLLCEGMKTHANAANFTCLRSTTSYYRDYCHNFIQTVAHATYYRKSIVAQNPWAYWPLDDIDASYRLADVMGNYSINGTVDRDSGYTWSYYNRKRSSSRIPSGLGKGLLMYENYNDTVSPNSTRQFSTKTLSFDKLGTTGMSLSMYLRMNDWTNRSSDRNIISDRANGIWTFALVHRFYTSFRFYAEHDYVDFTLPLSSTNYALTISWDQPTGNVSVYVAGLLRATKTVNTTRSMAAAGTNPIILGRDEKRKAPYYIYLDELAIFKKAVSSAEVKAAIANAAISNSGGGSWTCPSTSTYTKNLFLNQLSCTNGTRTAACKVKLDACITAASTSCTDVAHCYSDWFQCKNLAVHHGETSCTYDNNVKTQQATQGTSYYGFENSYLHSACIALVCEAPKAILQSGSWTCLRSTTLFYREYCHNFIQTAPHSKPYRAAILASQPLAYWPMDDIDRSKRITDVTGNATINGTGAPSFTSSWYSVDKDRFALLPDQNGSAVYFDEYRSGSINYTYSYYSKPLTTDKVGSGGLSLEMWIRQTSYTNGSGPLNIISDVHGGKWTFALVYRFVGNLRFYADAQYIDFSISTFYTNNHLAITWNTATGAIMVYLNGASIASKTISTTRTMASAGTNRITMGRDEMRRAPFGITIDEVVLHSNVLPASTITARKDLVKPPPTVPSTPSPSRWSSVTCPVYSSARQTPYFNFTRPTFTNTSCRYDLPHCLSLVNLTPGVGCGPHSASYGAYFRCQWSVFGSGSCGGDGDSLFAKSDADVISGTLWNQTWAGSNCEYLMCTSYYRYLATCTGATQLSHVVACRPKIKSTHTISLAGSFQSSGTKDNATKTEELRAALVVDFRNLLGHVDVNTTTLTFDSAGMASFVVYAYGVTMSNTKYAAAFNALSTASPLPYAKAIVSDAKLAGAVEGSGSNVIAVGFGSNDGTTSSSAGGSGKSSGGSGLSNSGSTNTTTSGSAPLTFTTPFIAVVTLLCSLLVL